MILQLFVEPLVVHAVFLGSEKIQKLFIPQFTSWKSRFFWQRTEEFHFQKKQFSFIYIYIQIENKPVFLELNT
jgi:hypothetical protein